MIVHIQQSKAMKMRRTLRRLWDEYCKWTEIQAWTEIRVYDAITREEYLRKIEEIEKRYERTDKT